ncbi:hypothetical protein FKW77_002854 [Venturia effusa]|uniref:Rhodopsin domain-containing protein n=1 Tax=Venturia effusa TaxID=50376 RepID=A0A517L8V6_9PEZI|nr:hypothetical protein FKW77_002854 [Venturia effusa]
MDTLTGPVQPLNYISIIAIVLQVFSTAFLALRLYSRISRRSGRAGTDDALLIVGWLFGSVLTSFAILGSLFWGYNRHVSDVPVSQLSQAAFAGWLIELLFILASSFNKLSVFLLYLRLINIFNNRGLMWATRACLAFVVLFMLVFTIIPLAKCQPISANWDMYNPTYAKPYVCIDDSITWPLAAALSAATDLAAVIIPLVILSGLRKPMKQKLGLYSVFAVGFLVVGAGIARTVLVTQLVQTKNDFTWIGGLAIIASLFEYHLALMCACAPSFRQVFLEVSHMISARSSDITEKPRTIQTNDSQRPITSLSFREVHTSGLGNGPGERSTSPLVAVAYEPGTPGIPIHLDISLQSPLRFPSAVWRTSSPDNLDKLGLRRSGLSSRVTLCSGPRTAGTSIVDRESAQSFSSRGSIVDELPELPTIFRPLPTPIFPTSPISLSNRSTLSHMSTITQPDPAMSPGFVACRGCGKFHPHGFSHADDASRGSGSGAWWRHSKSKVSSSLWRRRESQSTFFMDDDEGSEGPWSPPVSP